MGVCRGLVSVIQSAQNVQVRARAPPRYPNEAKLKYYSKKLSNIFNKLNLFNL